MARVYLPVTLELLARLLEHGELPPGVERLEAVSSEEDDEYAALLAAADGSAALLGGPGRRVVVVAETGRSEDPVLLRHVVAVHADDADVDPGAASYQDAPELGWWATQEIPDLLGR